jgi:hypothetical protein
MAKKRSESEVRREIKELLQEVYSFGYFVGYMGHSEWVGWVREKKEELYKKGKELGVYDLVKDAYLRGKEDGSKKRQEEINLGLIEKGRIELGEEMPKIEIEAPSMEEKETELEFARFLQTTRLVLPPEFLDTLKHLELPKMLRMGEM